MAEISMKLLFRTSAIVLIGLFSIFAVSCSEDKENKKEDVIVVDFNFVGSSWEIVSINGEMFETFFSQNFAPEQSDDIEAEQESTLFSNNWVFEDNGSLTGNLAFEVSEKYPGPPASSMTQKLTQTIAGMYIADEETLKITTEDTKMDVEVTLEPKEVWAAQIVGKTVEQLEADLAAESKSGFEQNPSDFIFDSGIEYTWNVTGDTLTLIYSDQKMVLKKK